MRRLSLAVLAALVALGGVLVLPATAAAAAETDGSDVSVTRYGGADRYVTSLQVAEAVAAEAGGSLSSVVLVSGRRWTDAVVAASVAGALGAPVLMTPPDELRADALEFLQRVGVSSAVVVGPDASGGGHGPGRGVGTEVLEALGKAGITAERVAGDDRYGTGVAAARRVTPGAMGELGRTAVIASGEVFADALVAGPFAARGIHPVLLSPPGELHADVAGYLGDAAITHVVLMGGTAALSEAVEQSVEDLGIDVSRVAGSTRYDTAAKAAGLVADRYSAAAGRTCFANDTIGVARARVPFDSFSAAPLLGRLCAPLVLADPGQIPADTAAYLDGAREDHDAIDLRVFGGDAAVSEAAIDAYLTGTEPEAAAEMSEESDESDADAVDSALLPEGACGGSASDPVRRLSDYPKSEDPAWSPDCTMLVYSRGSDLHVANANGSDTRKIVAIVGAFLDEPAWSPDGKRIAFQRLSSDGRDEDGDRVDSDRRIATIGADGSDLAVLNPTDRWERSPAWSPDGTAIAFIASDLVWVMRVDGTDLVAATIGGVGARRVTDLPGWATLPRWSPDGASIAFTHFDQAGAERDINGDRFASAVGADSGKPLEWAMACRPRGVMNTTAGFPLPDWAPSSTGDFRVAVLFMDFPDAQATHTTEQEAGSGLAWAEEYLETVSYGQIDVEFVPHHTWLRAEQSHMHYLETDSVRRVDLSRTAAQHAVTLAGANFDYSSIDAVMTVFPRTHFFGGVAGGFVEADGARLRQSRINSIPRDEPQELAETDDWGSTAAHELAHNLGLLDMYPYDRSVHEQPEAPHGQVWVNAEFGLMQLDGYFLSAENDQRRQFVWRHIAGAAEVAYQQFLNPREMLAWSRWQLNWLNPGQARCITEDTATVTLAPIARPGDGVAMVAIPISQERVIVLESRRELGYDRDLEYAFTAFDGWRAAFPSLIEEGVLVYTVDSFIGSGDLPVKIAGDSGNGQVDGFPVLQAGESVTVAGWTITVTADDSDTHTVLIQKQ